MTMEAITQDTEQAKGNITMNHLGSHLRNMAIPSPPSIPSSSDDTDELSEDEDENAAIDYFLPGRRQDLASRLLLAEEDGLSREQLSSLTLVCPETQARLEALLEAAGVAADGKAFTDPEVLRRLTSSVSSALDEAAAALTRMQSQAGVPGSNHIHDQGTRSLVEACIEGDIAAVRKLLDEGRSVHEPTEEGESLLSLACSAGYYELVQVLLAMNANVEDRGIKGDCTPLMEAASGGFVDIVRLLLQRNASVNAQSSAGNTALHHACCGGYEDVVQVLLEHDGDLEHQNENGHTPLMEAASGGHVGVARLLLDKGAGINTHSSEFKESALTLACYKGHVSMVKFLLERGADQEHKTDEMHTALMEASMDGHVEVARLLLEHGAQVNMPADSFESPLTLAACGSHIELAQLLIEHGANLEEANDEGYTPLMEAAREGFLPMVVILVEHGAKVNAQTDETQETALTLACCGGFHEIAAYLLEAGADIELGASTPLMEAATEGHVELVRFLLAKGAKVDAATATGDTALSFACENGHTDIAIVLIEAGADLENESEGGRTPLMKGARAGHITVVEYLILKGADVNRCTNNNDHSVLSLACAGGHRNVVELLIAQGADLSYKLKDNSSMLIEAAKGGHTIVASLLIDTPMQLGLSDPMFRPGFATPVGSPNEPGTLQTSHICQHMSPISTDPNTQAMDVFPNKPSDCLHSCQHAMDCMSFSQHLNCNFSMPPPAPVAACPIGAVTHSTASTAPHTFPTCIPSPFVAPPTFPSSAAISLCSNGETMTSDASSIVFPTLPAPSLPNTALPLSNLTHADLQSLAHALSFSASVNSMTSQHDTVISTSASVAENLGIAANVTFPPIDTDVSASMQPTSSASLSTSNNDIVSITATSAVAPFVNPDMTSTGVQTDDAVSMIHKLTNSVHQLSALQNFAAAHNLELVNLGEISIPQTPFPLNPPPPQDDCEYEDDSNDELDDVQLDSNHIDNVMIAGPPKSLEDTLASMPREDPAGECVDIIPIPNLEPLDIEPHDISLPLPSPPLPPVIDIDQATESNHDTALTIACAGGHDELVQMLLMRGSDIEHKDKKGCTPLILAATAGHASTCRLLLDAGADIEAQSDRTKDTALSLACSSGRQEVVELLLSRKAVYEHRNVSDYTPLSLAASGGYVGIIKVLLNHGAEINSRTGSKLGISPLMLAAMNGHVAAVKLLLDSGSDVNAQIETNRNTALTLACFQGRQEVVSLLLDRKANVEHRAKTGLTPLMEAASGGYVDVGRVLIERGADVNAPPVPSSRDTALTIAADKGHCKFVECLLSRGASSDVKNKKGCSPLWLAANGGHLDVVQLLSKHKADVDSQDNRGVSCLMAAFRKGHVKVIRWLVRHVTQFPADPDCTRFMLTVSDKELQKKLQECMDVVISAKERQAAEANKNASILLEEIDHEKQKEERRKAAAAKKRDKKKRKKKKTSQTNGIDNDGDDDCDDDDVDATLCEVFARDISLKEERLIMSRDEKDKGDTPSDEKPSQPLSSSQIKANKLMKKKEKKMKPRLDSATKKMVANQSSRLESSLNSIVITSAVSVVTSLRPSSTISTTTVAEITRAVATSIMSSAKSMTVMDSLNINADVAATMATAAAQCAIVSLVSGNNKTSSSPLMSHTLSSPKKNKRIEEDWKEVTRRSKKILIPASLISRVIGRGGCNVNAIRDSTGAHIDIDTNRKKANGDCMVTIKGSQQGTRLAYNFIEALIVDPDRDVSEILPPINTLSDSEGSSHSMPPHPHRGITTINGSIIRQHYNVPSIQGKNATLPHSLLGNNNHSTQSTAVSNISSKYMVRHSSSYTSKLPPRMGGPSSSVSSISYTSPHTTASGNTGSATHVKENTFDRSLSASWSTSSSSSTGSSGSASSVNQPKSKQRSHSTEAVSSNPLASHTPGTSTPVAIPQHGQVQKSPAARQLFPSPPTKLLPKPIGSNRPIKGPLATVTSTVNRATTQTTQATRTAPSIQSNNSSLNSLFSQVATQARSPMIWNDVTQHQQDSNGHDVIMTATTTTTIASCLSHGVVSASNAIFTQAEQLNASQSTMLAQTLTSSTSFTRTISPASISPVAVSSEAISPVLLSNVIDERPHLNPIGTERAHKRPPSNTMTAVTGLTSFLPDPGHQNVWGFNYAPTNQATAGWSLPAAPRISNQVAVNHHRLNGTAHSLGKGLPSPVGAKRDHEDEVIDICSDDTVQSVLDRLSLAGHLSLFQQNEIDLDALMLMTEQDYADIGLPKGPRVKLLKSTRRCFGRNNNIVGGTVGVPLNPLGHSPQPHMWSAQTSVVDSRDVTIPQLSSGPHPNLIADQSRYNQSHIMNPWQAWSRTADQ